MSDLYNNNANAEPEYDEAEQAFINMHKPEIKPVSRKENIVTEDDIAMMPVDEDFLMEGDSPNAALNTRRWAVMSFIVGILFAVLHVKFPQTMTLEESRITLAGSVIMIACSVIFLAADFARNGRNKKK